MKHTVLLFACLFLALSLSAKRQRTGPARLLPETTAVQLCYDTIVPPEGSVVFAGFDKPNNANKETFFVTNNIPDSVEIISLNVKLTYTTSDGKMLHSASHLIKSIIPPGETRSVAIPAWDRNHSFHYFRSAAPARRASTPFHVTSALNFVVVSRK